MQLDALLRSYATMVEEPAPLRVLYRASNSEYVRAYRRLADSYDESAIQFDDETAGGGFEVALRELVSSIYTPSVFFLVDDILFIRQFNLHAFATLSSYEVIPSLRLGKNITRSYTRRCPQRQPRFRSVEICDANSVRIIDAMSCDLVAWRWQVGQIDWNYPFSLDGNIFPTGLVRSLFEEVEFSGPNSLEAGLDRIGSRHMPMWGICFSESRLVNSPINRVQGEVVNFSGEVNPELLLELWNEGMRMDISDLRSLTCSSVHEEIMLPFIREFQ